MDGSASIGLEQALLGHSLGFAPFAAPTQVYVSLCLASQVPSETVRGLEASGGGYARMPATFALIAGPSNIAANTTSIEFPQALSSWGQIGFFELWDAPSGGNRLYWGQLVSTTDFTTPLVLQVSAGDITRFSAGTLGVQASTGAGGTASIGAYLPLAGGQMGGPLLLSQDPLALNEAATKSYVDAHSGTGGGPGFLPLSGGTMLGALTLAGGGGTLSAALTSSAAISANLNAFDISAPNPGFTYAMGAQVGGITGTLPIAQNYGVISFRNKGTTDTVHSPFGGGISMLATNFLTGGPGVTGNRTGEQVVTSIAGATGNKAAGYTAAFYGAAAWTMQMQSGDGGTDFTDSGSYGHVYAVNPVVMTYSGATFLNEVFVAEFDIACRAGSSTRAKSMLNFVQLASDVVQASAPDADGVTTIANPPGPVGWRDFGYAFGTPYHQWAFNASAALIKVYQDQGGGTMPARWGVDMHHATFPATGNAYDGGFWRTKGASLDGAGMLRLGTTYLTPGTTGLSIDARGSVGASATVAAGGSNWVVGLFARDPYGGFWRIATVSGGAAATVIMVIPPTAPTTTPPANPIALTAYGTASVDYSATGLTINIAWNTTGTALSLQPTAGGKLGFYGATPVAKQTGVAVTAAGIHAALTALGLIAP